MAEDRAGSQKRYRFCKLDCYNRSFFYMARTCSRIPWRFCRHWNKTFVDRPCLETFPQNSHAYYIQSLVARACSLARARAFGNYFRFLNSFTPSTSVTNSKPCSTSFAASSTVFAFGVKSTPRDLPSHRSVLISQESSRCNFLRG